MNSIPAAKPIPPGPVQGAALAGAVFVGSYPDPATVLDPVLPEVAFIGRSNVGKSSLLNALVGKTGLARVSSTPGKTTLMNVYRLPLLYLVDLPGYGFARAGKADRESYRRLLDAYLRHRPTLTGAVWLLDIRHDPSVDDRAMQELLIGTGVPVLAVLTKADKLTRNALADRVRVLAGQLGLPEDQVQPTSTRTGLGIRELAASVAAAAAEPLPS